MNGDKKVNGGPPNVDRRWYGHTNETFDSVQHRARLQRLVENPDKFIDILFATVTNHGEEIKPDWVDKMSKSVQLVFEKAETADLYKIPSLNCMDAEKMKLMGGKVVRFRCMVQEVMDPCLYVSNSKIEKSAGDFVETCWMYKDITQMDDLSQDIGTPSNDQFKQLELLHCITVPGENKWVSEVDKAYMDNSATALEVTDQGKQGSETPSTTSVEISLRTGQASESQTWPHGVFPLKSMYLDPFCKVVTAQIYAQPLELKVNDVVELFGILSFDEDDNDEAISEDLVISDPTPAPEIRLLVLGYSKKISFDIPRMLLTLDQLNQLTLIDDWRSPTRNALLSLLEDCLLGDKLCAQYLLMNIISNVNARINEIPMGSFGLTILELNPDLCQFINMCIQALVTKSVFLPKCWDSIETDMYSPRKTDSGDLQSGILQLSQGTHLLVEETELTEQQYHNLRNSTKATDNVAALQKLIEFQVVEYEFQFHRGEFNHDVPVLVLTSSNKSLLNGTVKVPFQPQKTFEEFEDIVKPRILATLADKSAVGQLRDFLLFAKESIKFNISSTMEKYISTSFSESRTTSKVEHRMDSEDFSRALTMARYRLQYIGKVDLTEGVWASVRNMETERKSRLCKLQK